MTCPWSRRITSWWGLLRAWILELPFFRPGLKWNKDVCRRCRSILPDLFSKPGVDLSEKMNRSIVAIAGGVLMVGLGKVMHFYSEEAALEAIDFNTLGLLLGMMILVAMLEPTGFFEYLAVLAARASKGKPIRLFVLLGSITTVLSMFLDNVTTVGFDRASHHPDQRNSGCESNSVSYDGSVALEHRRCRNPGR